MVSHQILRAVVAVLLLLVFSNAHATDPIASIDRSVISFEDTLTLTIHIDDAGNFDSPDTAPLERDFQVLGTSQSSRHSFTNGTSQSSTEWIIQLAPRHQGILRIPAIRVAGKQTQSLTVNVEASAPSSMNSGEPIFLESEISSNSVYVQQQLIFTVRVFQSIQLDNMNLSEIEFDDALVEKLSQNSFQRRIDNQLYRVHEIRYAIFPQRSGTLTIPEAVFTANEVVNQRSIFSLPGQGRIIRRLSQQHNVEVLDPPPAFAQQSDNPWLPANDIQLLETWSSSPDEIRVGDSITRSITLKTKGLLASQLPPYEFKPPVGARFYPDQGKTENSPSEQGMSSVRTDSVAIIPTQAGPLQLPAITISWWDTRQQKIRKAVIESRTIDIKSASPGSLGNSTPLAIDHSTPLAAAGNPVAVTGSDNVLWQTLTAVFAGLWLITLWLWWQRRDKSAGNDIIDHPAPQALSEKQLFKQLLHSCEKKDVSVARASLIAWGQVFWPDYSIKSLSDIEQHCGHPALKTALSQLDSYLYGTSTQNADWKNEVLVSILKTVRQSRSEKSKPLTEAELAPLYHQS